ncbi:MAG: hypothetical protein KGH59_04740 [Candidatus Micrarchaeota archaeon]|nr:hypothetical protein [Candidatus Micrarchaeota archaeon]MDE1805057.1 hypothetical protein [Candidatus Micrarchaeota archaeon]MDE1847249.1 hypothetical protein [Candidatus Micrarchaeota archaeon]
MGILGIFGKTFDILKSNPRAILPYLIVTAFFGGIVLYTVFSGLSTAYGINVFGPATATHGLTNASSLVPFYMGLVPVVAALLLVSLFINPLLLGMYLSMADQGYNKKKVSLGGALEVAKRNYAKLFAVGVAIAAIWLAAIGALAAIFLLPLVMGGFGAAAVLWLLLGALVFLVVAVVLGILLYEAFAIVVLEHTGAIAAIKRSIEIGRKNMRNIFAVFIVLGVIVVAYSIALALFQIAMEFAFSGFSVPLVGALVAQAVNFLLGSVMGAWFALLPAGVYFEFAKKVRSSKRRKG